MHRHRRKKRRNALSLGRPKTGTTITTTWSPDNNPGSKVTVTIVLVYPTAIPFSKMNTISVGASSQAIILQ